MVYLVLKPEDALKQCMYNYKDNTVQRKCFIDFLKLPRGDFVFWHEHVPHAVNPVNSACKSSMQYCMFLAPFTISTSYYTQHAMIIAVHRWLQQQFRTWALRCQLSHRATLLSSIIHWYLSLLLSSSSAAAAAAATSTTYPLLGHHSLRDRSTPGKTVLCSATRL